MILNLVILFGFLILLIVAISVWKIHPFLVLILTALGLGISMGLGGAKTVEVLLKGFGSTMGWIAVIIILGAFIGEILQESGGAVRIAEKILSWVGPKRVHWAMGLTGYIVSIPVFVDVAYILLQPVTESLAVRSKKPVLYVGLALAAGLSVAHTLIPPTPGPLAVASLLQLNIGKMLMINLVVALFAMSGGILFVQYFVKESWLNYDSQLQEAFEEKESEISSQNVLFDLLPILVPIALMGSGAFFSFPKNHFMGEVLDFLEVPLVAVLMGATVAIFQIPSKKNRLSSLNSLVERAIVKSALVIMITGAGGSLGFVIKETGIQNDIVQLFSTFPLLGALLPFAVASLLTIATGSITVSLVGSASMLAPLIDSLPVSPEITAALIGCGAFCVFHANSSFFWLLNRLHQVPPKVLYRTFTLQSLCMGLSGLVGVWLVWLAFG